MIHNVSDKNLIKIQNLCHTSEQSARHGQVTDARNMLKMISSIALDCEKALAKGKR